MHGRFLSLFIVFRRVGDRQLVGINAHNLRVMFSCYFSLGFFLFAKYIYLVIYWLLFMILWCRGLLASKMYDTAKSIVTNLIFLIEEYGYVLNGARAYYTNRR